MIVDPRICPTEPCSGGENQKPTFARFSEPLNFRLFQQYRSFPDLGARKRDVRFTPMSRHRQLDPYCPKSATGSFATETRCNATSALPPIQPKSGHRGMSQACQFEPLLTAPQTPLDQADVRAFRRVRLAIQRRARRHPSMLERRSG